VRALAFGLVVVAVSSPALAGGGGDAHGVDWKNIAYHAANLALFLVAFVILLRKPLMGFLAQRRAVIAEGLEEAARLRSEAASKLQALEAQIANLAAEREKLVASYREEGERDRAAIAEGAQRAAESLRREATFLLEQETRALQKRIRDRAVEAALARAEQLILAQITLHDRVRLADEYIDKLKQAASAPR
jgi:F-type H+-transporting ATPase subunit b